LANKNPTTSVGSFSLIFDRCYVIIDAYLNRLELGLGQP